MTADDLAALLEKYCWAIGDHPRTDEEDALIGRVVEFMDKMRDAEEDQ